MRLISHAETACFKRCRREWWLSHYRRLELARMGLTGHRQTGTRTHLALAAWYQPDGQSRTDPREALEAILRAEVETWLSQQTDQPEEVVAGQLKAFESDADLVRAMIEGYVQWLEETGADSDLEVIAPERALKLQLDDEDDVWLVGRLDAVVRRVHDEVLRFIDHKTVGGFVDQLQLRRDEQMLTYETLLNGQDDAEYAGRVQGAIFNMLRKVKRTSRAKPPFFHREETTHNHHELEAFKERLIGTVSQILLAEELLNDGANPLRVAYPTPTRDCSWRCDHFAVCSMFDDGSRAEDLLQVYYRQKAPDDRYEDLTEELT